MNITLRNSAQTSVLAPQRGQRPSASEPAASPPDSSQLQGGDADWHAQNQLRLLAQQSRAGATEPAKTETSTKQDAAPTELSPSTEKPKAPKKGLIEGFLDLTNNAAQVVIGGLSNVGIIVNSLAGISTGLGVLGLLK